MLLKHNNNTVGYIWSRSHTEETICKQDSSIWFRGAVSRCAPSQWETSLQNNAVSHWLGAHEIAPYVVLNSSFPGQNKGKIANNFSVISSLWLAVTVFFHWCLFLDVWLMINRHWLRWWLGTEQATSHYLNQWWPSSASDAYIRPQGQLS